MLNNDYRGKLKEQAEFYRQLFLDGEIDVVYAKDFYNTFFGQEDENIVQIDGVLYYQIPKNKYFCLGDNRAYSYDSRSRGLFDKSRLTGVAEIIVKDGALSTGSLASKKINAIVSYYWKRLEKSFAR